MTGLKIIRKDFEAYAVYAYSQALSSNPSQKISGKGNFSKRRLFVSLGHI